MTDQLPKTEPERAANSRSARPKIPSSKTKLIKLLSRMSGADAVSISEKFGWQAHTTRATLSRLRKAGFGVAKENTGSGKPIRYRIVSTPIAAAAAKVSDGK